MRYAFARHALAEHIFRKHKPEKRSAAEHGKRQSIYNVQHPDGHGDSARQAQRPEDVA